MRKYMSELIFAFMNGRNAYAATARVENGVFYSYSTPIAINRGDKIQITLDKFTNGQGRISKTTSSQQNSLLAYIPESLIEKCTAEEIKKLSCC